MKRKAFCLIILAFAALALWAVPAKPGLWRTLTLADGTKVTAELRGDEHGHYWRAADGSCYVVTGDSTCVRRDVTDLEARRAARRLARRKACYASTSDGLGKYGQSGMGAVGSIGEYTLPVIMVQFSDTKFKPTTTVEKMARYYNEEGYGDESGCKGSVRDYFKAQSYGHFVPTFDVVGIVTLPNSYKAYGANDRNGDDKDVDEMVADAVAEAVGTLGVDFSRYAVGGKVPLVCILYAGRGEATEAYGGSDYVWPCEVDCETTMSGTFFNSYFVGNEIDSDGTLMGMGVFCHEFGHALGLPDFYVTDYSYSYDDPFSNWSIMDCGAYVNDGRAPIGYTAYERSYLGWLDMPEATAFETLALADPNKEGRSAVIVRNPASSVESFILENRQPGIWYPASFGSGLMLTRIVYDSREWNENTLNNVQTKKRAMMVTANGDRMSYSASEAHLYGNGADQITGFTLYDGGRLSRSFKDIAKHADGTITFSHDTGTAFSGDTLFYESFDDCAGKGGNDGVWSGNGTANSAFRPDVDGWAAYGNLDFKASGASQCAKFGTGSVKASILSPELLVKESATLTFLAAPWGTENCTLQVGVEGSGVAVSGETSFPLANQQWNMCTLELVGSGMVRLHFTPAGSTRRFFLDEVKVEKSVDAAIRELKAGGRAARGIYSLDGRRLGKNSRPLPRGIYIKDGKKIVIH